MTDFDASGFAETFQRFLQAVSDLAPDTEPEIRRRLREHLGEDTSQLPTVGVSFPMWEQPNLQLGLDAWLRERPHELLGVTVPYNHAPLLQMLNAGHTQAGPPVYEDVQLGNGRVITCLEQGIVLAADGDAEVALLVSVLDRGMSHQIMLDVVCADRARSHEILADVRRLMLEHNVYRGAVVSMAPDQHGGTMVMFHDVPAIGRDGIILPDGVLERLERHTVVFAEHAEQLRAAGRHLKRGILLHGPPGTGKTLAIRYVITSMPGRTTVVLKGAGFAALPQAFEMARLLSPSTIVMEDVDLVAEERTHYHGGGPILFELLNQMDGVDEDTDLVLLLTTNRPDLLEPALAQRPGRVDLALEIPLPDAAGRHRLVDLYSRGLSLGEIDVSAVIARTHGASGAFFRELLRRAALIAAGSDGGRVSNDHIQAALDELTVTGDDLSRALLGGSEPGAD